MTTPEIASALTTVQQLETQARTYWGTTDRNDLAERDASLVVVRNAAHLARCLERWIAARACRAAQQQKAG